LIAVTAGVGAVAGVAVGAAVLAGAATTPSASGAAATAANPRPASDSADPGSTTTTSPTAPGPAFHGRGFGPGGRAGFGGLGGFGGFGGVAGAGPAIYGQYTVKGPNGYETIAERTGTVSDVTDTSGSTWTLTVKSADGTSGTFTVDSGTSVNGGESGIGSVKQNDTVTVVAVVSDGTSTAKQVVDRTVLKADGGSWTPMRPQPAAGGAGPDSGSTGGGTTQGIGGNAPPV
jgi:hypothetical protein